MSAQKRKQTDFTLKEKKGIIDATKNEPNQSKLAREISKKWGVEIKRTTVKGILSKKDAIETAIKAEVPSKRMKLMHAHDPKLDDGVLMMLKQARGRNLRGQSDQGEGDETGRADACRRKNMRQPTILESFGLMDNMKK